MSNKNTVIFNAAGMEFGIVFVVKKESTITPIRDIANKNGMTLILAGTSDDDDNAYVLSKGEGRPKGHNFLNTIKDVCKVENGWYMEHGRTDIPYMMFMHEECLAEKLEEAILGA